MKLNKIMMAAVIALGVSSVAHAAVKDQGHGKVTFTGSIIDAPCSITPDSIDQTIELGQISKVALKDGGKSTPRNFSIDLENCEVGKDNNNKVTVTFTGMESMATNGPAGDYRYGKRRQRRDHRWYR
ncbi:Fimbria A protein precursor [Serratia fonticola]|uniref:Fimbria A protein n=1 Tax=Serratia fonticola TaxID=47917 RepID=A0A4V6KW39_SERFO|nr:Fimbria A protein precursor [Serratia fonticola]